MTVPDNADLRAPQELTLRLVRALESAGVAWCHWKSNYHLDYAMSGDEDLDVLVARSDYGRVTSILADLEFVEAQDASSVLQPGVFHFLGQDPTSDRLVHLHVYNRILTGDHVLKSYGLPFERMLLENTRLVAGARVPSREAEVIVYVLRGALKHTTLLDLYLMSRTRELVAEEHRWLTRDLDIDACLELLARYFPEIDGEDFTAALGAMGRPDSTMRLVSIGRRMERVLARYCRYTAFERLRLGLPTVLSQVYGKLVLRERNLKLASGGLLIAFVGPQATGKSTLARALGGWLGRDLAVRYLHAGKPPSAWLTWLPNRAIPLARRLMPQNTTSAIEKQANEKQPDDYGLVYLLRKVMLAWDRRKLLRRAYRRTRAGGIVLSDRYPSDTVGAVDGATFADSVIDASPSALKRALMRLERRLYDDIPPPDLVVELFVPVEKAVHRDQVRDKIGPKDPEYVRFRHTMKFTPSFRRSPVVRLDTDRPLDETVATLRGEVWRRL